VSEAGRGSFAILRDVMRLGKEHIESYRAKGISNGPKLGYIYCSGTWIHGSSVRPVTDLDVVGPNSQTPPEERALCLAS
jgi:hypothetical protein